MRPGACFRALRSCGPERTAHGALLCARARPPDPSLSVGRNSAPGGWEPGERSTRRTAPRDPATGPSARSPPCAATWTFASASATAVHRSIPWPQCRCGPWRTAAAFEDSRRSPCFTVAVTGARGASSARRFSDIGPAYASAIGDWRFGPLLQPASAATAMAIMNVWKVRPPRPRPIARVLLPPVPPRSGSSADLRRLHGGDLP